MTPKQDQGTGEPQQRIAEEGPMQDESPQAESGSGDSPEGKAQQQDEDANQPAAPGAGDESSEDDDDPRSKAQKAHEEREKAKETIKELEEDPPEKLEDWPDDQAKYETFGGPEGNESYDESVTKKLGPSSLRHHEDGKVTVEGEEVDNPDEFKGDPIPGGPTDPNAPQDSTTQRARGQDDDDSGESEDGGDQESDDSQQSEEKAEKS